MVSQPIPVRFDSSAIAQQLCDYYGADANYTNSRQIAELINIAFFSSMEREEGRFVTFAVALTDQSMLDTPEANRKNWHPILFANPIPLNNSSIAKLANAIDHNQTYIAIADRGGDLMIVGVIRTNASYHRFRRGELSSVQTHGYKPVVVTAKDVGTIDINFGSERFTTITKGARLPHGVPIFDGGLVFSKLSQYAVKAKLDSSHYNQLLCRVIQKLSDRLHGGIVLILPEPEESALNIGYQAKNSSSALQDATRFLDGDDLGPTIHSYAMRVDGSAPTPIEREISRQRERAVEEYLFLDDVASFAADLASVDGALVLLTDLSIIGFGAHILSASPANPPLRRFLDKNGKSVAVDEEAPFRQLGTRHNSAARFCFNRPGSLAFVVSQDGTVSCLMASDTKGQPVSLWKPVVLVGPMPAYREQ